MGAWVRGGYDRLKMSSHASAAAIKIVQTICRTMM